MTILRRRWVATTVQIVKRTNRGKGFEVLPGFWVRSAVFWPFLSIVSLALNRRLVRQIDYVSEKTYFLG